MPLSPRAAKRLNRLIDIGFLVVLAAVGTHTIRLHLMSHLIPPVVLEVPPSVEETKTQTLADYRIIAERGLFGTAKTTLGSTQTTFAAGSLRLIGTVAGRREHSVALIASTNGDVEVVRNGDRLGAYEVTDIQRGRVSLLKNGDVTELSIDWDRGTPMMIAEAPPNRGIRPDGEDHFTVSRELIDETMANPMNVMREARFVPEMDNGKINGFKVTKVKNGGLAAALGLTPGDVVRRVNGKNLDDMGALLALAGQLSDSKGITVDIERGGNRRTLEYNIR